MTDQLTPWYDPKVDGQPVRVGWYQREYKYRETLDYWDGFNWYMGYGEPHQHLEIFANGPFRWRGLTKPNEEKQ